MYIVDLMLQWSNFFPSHHLLCLASASRFFSHIRILDINSLRFAKIREIIIKIFFCLILFATNVFDLQCEHEMLGTRIMSSGGEGDTNVDSQLIGSRSSTPSTLSIATILTSDCDRDEMLFAVVFAYSGGIGNCHSFLFM